jgi:radical SAM family uncharacterized protein
MLNKILPFVKRPLRYVNSEWNSCHKEKWDVNVCLCFPDLYELAISNMGLEILYHIINTRDGAVCERCYCPDTDMEQIMRRENIKLFSLESQKPIKEFDIIGFSLQYELCFTNVLTMLELAGVPLFSKDRNEYRGIVIAGGPVCANPEPVSEYFDAFVLGDGEDVINEIINVVKEYKSKRDFDKNKLLLKLANVSGVYVPRFYDVNYRPDGSIEKILPNNTEIPESITRCRVDIKSAKYPVRPIVPYLDAVHDRFNVEISRGCRHNCRFCQATNIYHPCRERPVEQIMDIIHEGIKQTGYEEVSLMSFSTSSYSRIDKLLSDVSEYCYRNNTFVTVPSLRCDTGTAGLLKYLVGPHRANLTFGIETGSEKLRKFIGKDIKNDEIYNTVLTASELGWKLIKLYFMYGLPTEKDEDIDAVVDLTKKIRRIKSNLKINITISPFVPKPHTPFQWVKQENIDVFRKKKKHLVSGIAGEVKLHDVEMSLLEGIFARGDRRLGKLIYTVWQKGAKFDHWKEQFNYGLWEQSFVECGIDKEFYLRERSFEEILPWEHLNYGSTKETLYKRYEQGKS